MVTTLQFVQTQIAEMTPLANHLFTGTVSTNNLDVSTGMRCNTVTAWSADKLTANDNLTVTGVLEADAIAPRTANEATVDGDLAVSGAFLVHTMRTSEANQISIDDNAAIQGTAVADKWLIACQALGPTQSQQV